MIGVVLIALFYLSFLVSVKGWKGIFISWLSVSLLDCHFTWIDCGEMFGSCRSGSIKNHAIFRVLNRKFPIDKRYRCVYLVLIEDKRLGALAVSEMFFSP